MADCEAACQQLTGGSCQKLSSWVQHQQELLLPSTEQASQAAATDGGEEKGPEGSCSRSVSGTGQAVQSCASAVRLLMRQGVAFGQLRRCASHWVCCAAVCSCCTDNPSTSLEHDNPDGCRFTEACDAIELAVAVSKVLADEKKTKALQADLAMMQQSKDSSPNSKNVSVGQ